MDLEIIEKNNKHYMKPVKTNLPYELDRAYFHLENLFNGNKVLGEYIFIFLVQECIQYIIYLKVLEIVK